MILINVPGLNGNPCSENNELAVYIHGVWTGQMAVKEQIDRTILSLNLNEYNIPVLGFSWDSNTVVNPSGWTIAKSIATQNGRKNWQNFSLILEQIVQITILE